MGVPNRLSGSLPVSIAVHAVLVCLLFVVPLTAQIALPALPGSVDAYIAAVPLPPPPTALASASAAPARTTPVGAPPSIVPERPAVWHDVNDGVVGTVDFGPPAVIGSPADDVAPPPGPAAIPRAAGPVRVGELLRAPQKIVDAHPVYPEFARIAHVQGTVVLEAILDRSGRIDQVRILRSVPLLDQAAIDAVRQWQYAPSTLHGLPVEVLMTITVTFHLQQ